MSEPTKLSIEEILGIPIETKAGFYIADDPALAEWKRDSEALRKLEKLTKNYYYVHITQFNDGSTSISAADCNGSRSLTNDDEVPPDLLSAIESIKEDKL